MACLMGYDLNVALRSVEIREDERHFVQRKGGAVSSAFLAFGGKDIHQPVFPHGAEEFACLG